MSDHAVTVAQMQALAAFDTPTIANALESLRIAGVEFLGPGVRAIAPIETPVVGLTVTATMAEQRGGRFDHLEPWLEFLAEIERTPLPVIAIFRDDSQTPGREAMIGEGMARAMRAAGAAAAICDGCMRDVRGLRQMSFPVLCAGLVADRGRIRFQRRQVPVEVAGMRVSPGDLIHADENGALVLPAGRIAEVLQAAALVTSREEALFSMMSQASFRVSQLEDYYADALRAARLSRQQASELPRP